MAEELSDASNAEVQAPAQPLGIECRLIPRIEPVNFGKCNLGAAANPLCLATCKVLVVGAGTFGFGLPVKIPPFPLP